MNRKRRSIEELNTDVLLEPFKRVNIEEDSNMEFKNNNYKEKDDFMANDMSFLMLNKHKNTLNNISKVSKKIYNLNKTTETITNKLDKYNKRTTSNMNKVCQELDKLKESNIDIMNKLNIILEYIQQKNDDTIEKVIIKGYDEEEKDEKDEKGYEYYV